MGWSKFFVPDQRFIYILWQSQTFCTRQKDDLHSVNCFLCWHKSFWRGTKWSQIFGLTLKIWTGTKHFATCKRKRHKWLRVCKCTFFFNRQILVRQLAHSTSMGSNGLFEIFWILGSCICARFILSYNWVWDFLTKRVAYGLNM